MLEIGIGVAVFSNGKIILTQREDSEVWCLPGSAVEKGESIAGRYTPCEVHPAYPDRSFMKSTGV